MEEKIEVIVKYGDIEERFSGSVEEVSCAFLQFLNKTYPGYELISRITLTVDVEKLLREIENIIASTPEGMVALVPREKLTDKEAILLHLLKTYVGYMLGKLDKDSLSTGDILTMTGTTTGAVAGRLSELVNEGWVMRIGKGEYRISTLGITKFVEIVIPKIKGEKVEQ